ncbi:MAG: Eco57I restriction-modification methylase domain-containing protein [Candidatus Hodarchaeales archaeon]
MQQLYQRLKEFYEILLKEGRSFNWTPNETYDIALQSLIKVISLFYFKPWSQDPNSSSFLSENVDGCSDFFLNVFIPNNKDILELKPIYQLISLKPNESKILQSIPFKVWDSFLSFIDEYTFSLKETFSENSITKHNLTPEFLSILTEMVLSDYEKDFMLQPKVTKRKKKGAYYSPWSIIRKLTDGILMDELRSINKTVFDPSCGTGSFLLYATERIYSIKSRYSEVSSVMSLKIVQKNIYGVDKSYPSILVAKLRLMFWIMSKSPLTTTDINSKIFWNIQQGNSLFGLSNEEFQPTIDLINIIPQIRDKYQIDLPSFAKNGYNLQMWMDILFQMKSKFFLEHANPNKENKYHTVVQLINPIFNNVYNQKLRRLLKKHQKSISLMPDDTTNLDYFHWGLFYPEILLKGGFDICLGNPPYGRSILTIAEKNLLKISYQSCQGQKPKKISLNAASAFLERSLTLLNPNGKLAFILPFSILRVEEFEEIRDYILEEYIINEIHDESSAFDEVTLEMCSMVITKKKKSTYSIHIYPRENYRSMENVNKSVFQTHSRFMIYYDPLFEEVLKQGSLGIIMADYGIDHRIVKKDLIRTHSVSEGYTTPFLHSGRSVSKYSLQPKYFHWAKPHQKNKRFVEYVKEPKLICTAIGNQFRVAYKPPGFVPGTNVSIMEITEPNYDLFPIMLILNSSLVNYILKRYILNYSHLTVYIHKYYTKLIPIKYPDHNINEWIILATYISFLKQLDILDERRSYENETALLERIIDYLVIHLYFPSTCIDLNICLEDLLTKSIVPIAYKKCLQILLNPKTNPDTLTNSHLKTITDNEKIIQNSINNLKENDITTILEQIKNLLRKHTIIPLEVL